MLYFLLFIAALAVGFVWYVRRHFTALAPPFRVDERHGNFTVRRYPKMVVAEVRVTGSAGLALRTATALLDRYFREEHIARFALPLLAEKVDSADPIWAMAAVLPMELEAAPAPRNKSIQLKEIPPHRAIARLLHGAVSPDEHLARVKAEMIPSVNDICRQLDCHKRSTVVTMHRFPWWMPSLFRVSDLIVRVTDDAC
ncbi:hypothetical protein AB1Y20_021289 [Prymnesium parvum]|uniref:Uncharacterized protein n=1 Tax=Prymnesium parvum TaxID=97485 RepID=A0AB34JIA1_PRYPA